MIYNFNFYSSLLLITFSQGLIYSILILKKAIQTNRKANYWLSLFVLICSLYVAPWMLGFAGWYDNQPYRDFMFYMPFQHLFFVGPLMFFYIQSLLNPSFKINRKQLLHLVLGVVYLLYNFWIFIYDKIILKEYYYYADGIDKDFDEWYQILGQISMAVYFILSLIYYNRYQKLIVQISSNADAVLFKWIKTYLIAFLCMILLPLFFDFIKVLLPSKNEYESSWWFYLVYSIILYYIAITGYTNAIETKIGFEMSLFDRKPIILLTDNISNESFENDIIDTHFQDIEIDISPEIIVWKIKIESLIQSQKLYQNPELSLTEIAKKLESNSSIISRAINQGFGMNFNDFINNYRIEAVKEMFRNGEHKKSTLIGIAYDCGFNSKATFNRAFKKNTNFSPKEYLNTI
ncbi:MAG: helix-turn-helix transcriptional regulator [Flavobacterium sp.]|nr:helix-turn-helix transcriptional regulator [Flavobacterium sp.]